MISKSGDSTLKAVTDSSFLRLCVTGTTLRCTSPQSPACGPPEAEAGETDGARPVGKLATSSLLCVCGEQGPRKGGRALFHALFEFCPAGSDAILFWTTWNQAFQISYFNQILMTLHNSFSSNSPKIPKLSTMCQNEAHGMNIAW